MEYNIINQYIAFLTREYGNYFKILLDNKYQKDLCAKFIEKYITVRYYNETNYKREKDIINRLNKELIDVFKENVTEENEDMLKNMVALFGYIAYFDDVCDVEDISGLIDTLTEDTDIKLELDTDVKKKLNDWYINLKKGKEKFNDTIISKDFQVIEKRVYRKLFEFVLEHNIKISNLYSEFAIYKAYNSGIIAEDKLFVTYILGSLIVLNNAINLDFSRHYMVDLASSLFNKEKKIVRLFNILNNPLAKKMISVRISYTDYIKNKERVNEFITDGYSFGIVIDNRYSGNIDELMLFPYIFVSEENEYYEAILKEKEFLKAKIIKL